VGLTGGGRDKRPILAGAERTAAAEVLQGEQIDHLRTSVLVLSTITSTLHLSRPLVAGRLPSLLGMLAPS